VARGLRRWVVMSSTLSFKTSVGSSEVITGLPDVTVAPHHRQKFASGSSSALHAGQRLTLITRSKYSRRLFWASTPVRTGSGTTWSAALPGECCTPTRSLPLPVLTRTHCRPGAFCDTQNDKLVR
jgi:hypothetical protein